MKPADVRITILVDNRADVGLVEEHGFSLWIEAGGLRILFDTGQGGALGPNADTLGIDVGRADCLVLSHGHFDHTGGIPLALRKSPTMDVYCHPGVVRPRYGMRSGTAKAIDMPRAAMAAMDGHSHRHLHWVRQPTMLSETVGVTGQIPRETTFEDTGGAFYLDPKGVRPDLIEDDLALFVRTDDGLVVCLGCCHAGLVNTIRHIRRVTQTEKIRAVIGGLHLLNADASRLSETVAALRDMAPECIAPCHCTGDAAAAVLQRAFEKEASQGRVGKVYRF